MKIIKKTENYNIYKLEKSIYKIIFENTSFSIVNSLVKSKIIMGSSTDEYYKIITFSEERYLPTSNWSDIELKNAISSYTQIPAENVFFISELSDEERTFLNTFPKQFMR